MDKMKVCVFLDEDTLYRIDEISDHYGLETRNGKANVSATIRSVVRRVWNKIQEEKRRGLGII